MKTVKKLLFPALLILSCIAVHFWQHAIASLPYLPKNGILPLSILTPGLLVLTFLTTFVLLKQSQTPKPVSRSFLSTAAFLAIYLVTGVYFLSFLTYRFAAVLPVLVLPDWPTGIMTMLITALCVLHLSGLLICRFVKQKATASQIVPAAIGWVCLNACLFLITT